MPLEARVSCQNLPHANGLYILPRQMPRYRIPWQRLLFKTILIFCYIPYPELLSLIETHCHFIVDPLDLCHNPEETASRFVLSHCPLMATLVQVKI